MPSRLTASAKARRRAVLGPYVEHDHPAVVDGCFRCELGLDELAGHAELEELEEAGR